MTGIRIRPIESSDKRDWLRMRNALWPAAQPPHHVEIERFFRRELSEPTVVFVAELDGRVVGMAELSVRNSAEGCATGNVGYLEGLYVEPDSRQKGVARSLVEAGEAWARGRGCRQFASDAELDNDLSAEVHGRLGFEEVSKIRCFRKSLAP